MPTAVRSRAERWRTTRGAPSFLPSMELKDGNVGGSVGLRRRLGAARILVPPLRLRRLLATREGERGEFAEGARVHRALEVDDFPHRLPVVRPAPLVELGLAGA